MSEFLERISRLSPPRLALLADELNTQLQAAELARTVPLAIVGIGCRLPGGVHDADSFWALLHDGVDAIRPIPTSRWNVEEFYDPTPDARGKMDTRWGGFIDGHDEFDPKFFGIAPSEAEIMDPQQRLLLETSWEALEHAGVAPASLAGTSTGVYVGICNGDYGQILLKAPRDQITPHLATGLSHAVAAGRISYVLGLQGPSMAVDTSCSASLVAVHLACQSLRTGECDLALAGGVNLILNPEVTIALSQSRMMAPDGRCKAFSDAANGFVRGEGSGIIVLQRLPDAVRDRRRVLAVIRGSACNQDGRSSGLTAPNGPSQEAVIEAALKDARMKPDDLDYIEAHGTGTALGDPIELGAINSVFSGRSASAGPLFVGSVKTNIGHLESAAGIAGLIKLVLSIQRSEIPPSLHFGTPNPRVEWNLVPIQIPIESQAWRNSTKKRAGGVSSFGFSGTNAHVVVEEYVASTNVDVNDVTAETDRLKLPARPLLFPLSAKSESALKTMALRLADYLTESPTLSLAGIARTLNTGRSHFHHRIAFVAVSREDLMGQLKDFALCDRTGGLPANLELKHTPRVAFVFCDTGDIDANSVRDLCESAPVFNKTLRQCSEILPKELGEALNLLLYPGETCGVGVEKPPHSLRGSMAFAIQFALSALWRHCGIEPSVVYGFGVGEIVAGCVGGTFSLTDGLHLAAAQDRGDAKVFEQCVRSSGYSAPQIVTISNSSGGRADFLEYWLTKFKGDPPHPEAVAALNRESCAAIIGIGQSASLRELQEASKHEVKWLMSSNVCSFTSRDFIETAAALYMNGFSLDMSTFYDHAPATTVPLPTYPFERKRYWIESGTDSKLDRASGSISVGGGITPSAIMSAEEHGWLYDLVWEPKTIAGAADEADSEMPATDELAEIAKLNAKSAVVYASYALQALRECGLDRIPKMDFNEDELAVRLKVAPNRRRIFGRLLEILVEDRYVERDGDSFRFINCHALPNASVELDQLMTQYSECRTELEILRRCGKKLSAVLQGTCDPMQLVFADGSVDEAEQIYEKSPVCRFFNAEVAKLISAAVQRINHTEGRPARILEIGAGTGATSTSVVRELSGCNFEYCFTDISPVFLARGRAKFSHVPSLTYRRLDIEKDPAVQNFVSGEYDIVLAANVLHATVDLRSTVAHVRQLLASGGRLFVIEGVSPDRWLDLTFGLTDGWWRFQDFDLRPRHPLINAEIWAQILREAGINSFHTSRYVQVDGTSSQQVLMRARVPSTNGTETEEQGQHLHLRRKKWMIFADQFGVGTALAKNLTVNGGICELMPQPGDAVSTSRVLEDVSSRSPNADLEIVYLWAMNAAEKNDYAGLLRIGIENSCKTLIHAIQALLKRDIPVRLSIVTRGAQPTGSFSPDLGGAVQSLAWGVGRVLGLEAPEQYGKLIDLDPAAPPEVAASYLAAELTSTNVEDQVTYREGERLVPRLRRARATKPMAAALSMPLRRDSSYLFAGGLGGLGLVVAQWAAKQGAGHLILLGRNGIGAGAEQFTVSRKEAIRRMEQLGARVTVVEGDVASDCEMKPLFNKFGTEFPPLRGVFHTATEVGVAKLADLSDDALDSMLHPKVSGTLVLHEHTKLLLLDFFVAFSSSTSLLGSKGMAHYAAANQFLDSFAFFRRSLGLPMLSINWGSWDVMRQASPAEQEKLRSIGFFPMESQKALKLMASMHEAPRFQAMIAEIDWMLLKPALETKRSRPMLEHMGEVEKRDVNRRKPSAVPASQLNLPCLAEAALLSGPARARSIAVFVQEQAAHVLGFRHGELPPTDVALTELGLDSLMAVDLKNRLQHGIGQELSPTILFDYPTVSSICDLLDTILWATRGDFDNEAAISQKDEIRI